MYYPFSCSGDSVLNKGATIDDPFVGPSKMTSGGTKGGKLHNNTFTLQ